MIMQSDKEKQILELLENINEKLSIISSTMKKSPARSEIIHYKEELKKIEDNLKKVGTGDHDNLLLFKKD